jgi:acyl-CoA synthetase (AMP-forming)/AMP-acid ligase II
MIFKSPLPDVDIPDTPLTPFVLRQAEKLGDKLAIIEAASGRCLTYGELARDVRRLAAGLWARGFRPGDVLAIMSPNLCEYPVAFHGTATAGGIVTTLNPLFTAEEIAFQLRDSKAKILLTAPPFLAKATEAAAQAAVAEVIVFGEADGVTGFASLLAEGPVPEPDIDPAEDTVVLPYSSGTTGFSKGVMLTHRNLVANVLQTAALFPLTTADRASAFLSFFHIYGMNVIMNTCLYQGATLVTMPRFEPEPFLQAVAEYQVTRLFLVPPVVLLLAKSPVVERYDMSSVKTVLSGAAPLDENVARMLEQRIGARVSQGYGLSETSPVTHAVHFEAAEFNRASVGILAPNTECKIVDVATGEELGPGRDGELWIRGPQVMKGYLNNEQATRAAINDEGFFHTGDVGHIDEHGDYFIVDRVKELIKYKGYQVPPAELEAHLLAHPCVADAAVIGVHDEDGEEIPKAFVVLKDPVSDADLMEFVASRVAPYKKIRRLEIVDEIPKSPTGKILRRLLRDREGAAHSAEPAQGP